MLRRNETYDSVDAPERPITTPETENAAKIEDVLRRAREIHRRRGGMFGYDFEDWVQAWTELPQDANPTSVNSQVEMPAR